ncbi:MAG TPA: energy transducer TonB [Bacteroidia bacterium]|nr:energy transducer TonB [Bacteroidia bacterium]
MLLCLNSVGQNKKAILLYNEAVKHYNQEHFNIADSVFGLSIQLQPDKDNYFGRALCRGKMADQRGYCEDLANASACGELKATALFLKSCGRIDTTHPRLNQNFTETVIFSELITYTLSDGKKLAFKQKYYSQLSDSLIDPKACDPEVKGEVMPTFPGGFGELYKFIVQNITMPDDVHALRVDVSKVFVKFLVYEDGTIHDVRILKGAPGCPGCDFESTRIITMMPRWNPGCLNGRPAKVYFTLPISFKVIR